MVLALLGRRQGCSLLRSLLMVDNYLGNIAASRPINEDLDAGADECSTSQHFGAFSDDVASLLLWGQPSPAHSIPFALQYPSLFRSWPRVHPVRCYAINNQPTIKYVPVPEPERDDFSGEPTTYLQLLGAIRSAKSLKRLQYLVEAHDERFDTVHVAAAIARLPGLIKYRSEDLVDRSKTVVMSTPGLPRMRRKHGSKPKPTHIKEGARIAARIDAMIPLHVDRFYPRQAACTIWAFGELRRLGIIESMASLPDVLLAITKGQFQLLRVHGHGVDFAQTLQGLAKLGYQDLQLIKHLVPLLEQRLRSMQQHELVMSVWALACLGYSVSVIYNQIADQLLCTGTTFLLPSGCSSAFWAFAKAGVTDRVDLFTKLSLSMTGQATLLAPQDAATTLWACSKLGFSNTPLFTILGNAMVRDLTSCSDWEVSSVIESLARLGHHHTELMDAVATAILAEPVIGAPPLCIARVLYGYGKLDRRSPRGLELASVLAAGLVPQLPVVREDTLALACSGLNLLGYNDQEVLPAFAARAEELLPDCSGAHLLSVLRLLNSAGFSHYQFAVASARHLQTVLLPSGLCTASGAIEVLYICALQGVADSSSAEKLMALCSVHEEELQPVDAARLFVVGQIMKRNEEILKRMADITLRHGTELDADTATAVFQSAQALGLQKLAAAVTSKVLRRTTTCQGASKATIAAT